MAVEKSPRQRPFRCGRRFFRNRAHPQTGAFIIGTCDRFSFGEPRAFIELLNAHTRHPEKNEVIFVEGTGHIYYSQREQALADILLRLARKWQAEAE